MTKQFVVGATPKSPQAGQSQFSASFLGECFVNYIIIDNQIYSQLYPNQQFKHLYLQEMVDISPNSFTVWNKVMLDITPIKPIL